MLKANSKGTLRRLAIVAMLLVVLPAAVLAGTHSHRRHAATAPAVGDTRMPTAAMLVQAIRDSSGSTAIDSLDSLPEIPFADKVDGRVGAYRLGYWPAEKGPVRSAAYENPEEFIRVTPANEDEHVSEHFELRDFLTHDQYFTWPKYVVLREPLLDKLELVIADLQAHGIPVQHMQIMSGFRAPEYNQLEVGPGGRVADSRHQYGDAADVFVDNNRDQRMDDLNHDGRSDIGDARIILQSVERVEEAHPSLIGGAGLYSSTEAHGPFIHIDARGKRARWGGA